MKGRHPAWLVVATSLWLASIGNLALWREMHSLGLFGNARGVLFGLSLGLIVAAVLTMVASLFTWRFVLKPVLMLFVVASALASHFMLTYRVVIDPTMMLNVVQTDPREVRDLLSLRFFVTVLLLGVLPLWAIARWRVEPVRWTRLAVHDAALFVIALLVAAGLGLATFQSLSSTVREHKTLRYLVNPFNSIYALVRVAKPSTAGVKGPVAALGADARPGPTVASATKPALVVIVLGETGRAGNFGLNGYARPTTPELSRLDVATFRDAWSCGTSTAASLPCMFSNLGREAWDKRGGESENLLDVARRAGFAVLWVDNQSGCKGVCDRVANVSTAQGQDPQMCPGGECFDAVMLEQLDARIAALPAEARARGTLVVLHQMGSHGPAYSLRSPAAFKRFEPECRSTSLVDCSREQIVNAYDNSIVYTDHVLGETIRWLQARGDKADTAMIYLADHGESLGENNLYLHGLPYSMAPDVQKHVPWITWASAAFEKRRRLDMACVRKRADVRVTHDNFFHSVLGLLDVQASVYVPALDAYAPCMAR